MLISVVIPVYNSGQRAIKAIDSVLLQEGNFNFEILIIDDGSVDGSSAFLQANLVKRSHVSYKFLEQTNGGAASARNLGMINAQGEYIAFLDSDDYWLPSKIKEQIHYFANDTACYMIGTLTNAASFRLPTRFESSAEFFEIKFEEQLFKNYFQTSTVIAKSEVFTRVGLFPTMKRFAEEGDLFFRITYTYKCILLNKVLVDYDGGKRGFGVSGLSGNLLKMEQAELSNLYQCYKRKHIGSFKLLGLYLYSLLKFCRRLLLTVLKKMMNNKIINS